MTDTEQVLLNRVKLISDGEWSLLGTPDNIIKELESIVNQAKIDTLISIVELLQPQYHNVVVGRITELKLKVNNEQATNIC